MRIEGVALNGLSVYDLSFNSNGALLYLDAGNTASYPGSGTTWTDLSTNQNNYTITGGPGFTNAGTDSYFSFNGTGLQYGYANNNLKYNQTYTGKSIIIAARLTSALTSGQYRGMFGTSSGFRNFNTYMYSPSAGVYRLHYSSNSVGGFSNNLSYAPNQWGIFSVTHTTGGLVTYYHNGQAVGTNTGATFAQWSAGGSYESIGVADNYWLGDIAVCAVYGRALSASEIQRNYDALSTRYSGLNNVTSNLVLYHDPASSLSYPGTGTTITDLSGNGLTGTMSNITHTSPYFAYNGTSSQVTVADNALLEPGSGSWTMEAWVYLSNTSGGKVILGKFDPGGGSQDVSYSMRISNANAFAQMGDGSGNYINSTSYTMSLNTWTQIVYVWKNGATKTLETYINGASIGSVNHSLNSILNTSADLYVGSYNGGEYSQWMNGRIGVTRLYNSALTSAEVQQNFDATRSRYGI